MKNKKIIYYWASNISNNNGEGILGDNFLKLMKINFKNYKFVSLNRFKYINQNTFFYKYIITIWAGLLLWKYYIFGKKVSYINFLPAWNFILILILPPGTILGPVTGSYNRSKYNFVIKILTLIGLKILNMRNKKILFSHNFFSKYFKKNKKYFYNFLLYNFKIKNLSRTKKYDYIFYVKKHPNKMNSFLIKLIIKLSENYKVCVVGEKIISKKNVFNMGFVSRAKTLKLINLSKAAVTSPENLYSYFLLDCISCKLIVFFNKNYTSNKYLKTELLRPIDFHNYSKSIKIIESMNSKKINKKIFFRSCKFDDYLIDL